jgi:hypothetical protein
MTAHKLENGEWSHNDYHPDAQNLEAGPPRSQTDLDYLREAFRREQNLPITDEERYQEEEYNIERYQIMIGCFAAIGALAFILAGMFSVYLIAQAIISHTGI